LRERAILSSPAVTSFTVARFMDSFDVQLQLVIDEVHSLRLHTLSRYHSKMIRYNLLKKTSPKFHTKSTIPLQRIACPLSPGIIWNIFFCISFIPSLPHQSFLFGEIH
jgi:hypothetical protein